ncbi:hypothetical protein ACQW5G_04060 [Fructilactobacillus sp. Tb1]|uniref:hypothetical protein n=1 Tax=Fructilactobacillus sp. Tb1 TaxID=3422304 RepID=UPI003D265677
MPNENFHLKRKERFDNKVILDLAYLLVDKCHLHVVHVGLFNHEECVTLNSKIDKVLDTEYTLDYLKEKQTQINSITLAKPDSNEALEIKRNGTITTNNKRLFTQSEVVVKAYFSY